MPHRIEIPVPPGSPPLRLDAFLSHSSLSLSRARIQDLIESGHVTLNGRSVRQSQKVKPGDQISLTLPDPSPSELLPEAIPLDILFEDGHLLVVNKPAGMAVHPAVGLRSGTLVNALLHHCDRLSGINGVLRPGIVHRLDRGTSGLLVAAKDDAAHRGLSAQLQARTVERVYSAFVWGHFREKEGRIEAPIGRHPGDRKRMTVTDRGSRQAATRFSENARFALLSMLEVRLETGRTHQIRVHFDHAGHPVFGDPAYGGREKHVAGIAPTRRAEARRLLGLISRQALHAQTLGFTHPVTEEQMRFSSALPEDMQALYMALVGGPSSWAETPGSGREEA